jgi:hypothetical protein
MSAKKDKTNKPDLSLIPYCVEAQVAQAMQFGEAKYGRYNYLKGHDISTIIAAAKRHIGKYYEGEDNDQESGVSHIAHAMANLLMLLHQQEIGVLRDDRFKQNQEKSWTSEISYSWDITHWPSNIKLKNSSG